MSDAEITARLRTILADVAPDLDVAAVALDADLRNDIGLDSMDFLNFVIGVHKHLGVNVPEADYGKVTSFSKFARYIPIHRGFEEKPSWLIRDPVPGRGVDLDQGSVG
jgi:acyl carrier protein